MKKVTPIRVVHYNAHGHDVVIEIFGSEKRGYWGSWRCHELLYCSGASSKTGTTIEDVIIYNQVNAFGGVGGHPDCFPKEQSNSVPSFR
jgi:hypothetical protein